MIKRMLKLLIPDLCIRSLAEVELDMLIARGIKAVILDLDNTLLPWRDYEIPPESLAWVKNAKEKGIKLFIASNTHNPRRLKVVAGELGIPSMDKIAKPRRRGLRAAMEVMGSTPATTAMIGDQIFTDIIGGNRLSLLTILVQPMHKREFLGTKISRLFEKPILAWLSKRGRIGTKKAEAESEIRD